MNRNDVLDKAKEAVSSRPGQYGSPKRNFGRIARYWSLHLFHRYGWEITLEPASVAIMMDLLKTTRLEEDPTHLDSWVDKGGYDGCGAEVSGAEPTKAKPTEMDPEWHPLAKMAPTSSDPLADMPPTSAEIIRRVVGWAGSYEKAQEWFFTSVPALGHKTPASWVADGRPDIVIDHLDRIETGGFS